MLRGGGFAGRIKCPAVAPADMERAFGSIEVGAEWMFFGSVAGEFAVFPNAGEFFEFVGGDLVIGSVGGLFFVVEDGGAGNVAAAGAENAFGIFFLGPPEDLVEPVHAPIAKGAVGVIEEV